MENLDDYLLSVENYKKGRYEFELVSSVEEIKKVVKNDIPEYVKQAVISGKKFVCIEKGSFGFFILGAVLILVWVFFEILTKFLPSHIYVSLMSAIMGIVFVTLGLCSIGIELLILTKPFIVLSKDGFAYKLRAGEVKGCKWKDVNMDFLEFAGYQAQYINLIRISLTNGSVIKIGEGEFQNRGRFYVSKELPDEKLLGEGYTSRLLFLTFFAYYNYGKFGKFSQPSRLSQGVSENKTLKKTLKRVQESSNNMEKRVTVELPNNLIIEDQKKGEVIYSLNKLKGAYKTYKNKKYTFGKYGTKNQIRIAHTNGKIFVLKGLKPIWFLFALMLMFSVWWFVLLISAFFMEPSGPTIVILILVFSTIGLFTVVPCILFGFMARKFLVVGPSGVYYRNLFYTYHFQWSKVTDIELGSKVIVGAHRAIEGVIAIVKINLQSGKKVKFKEISYRCKEFTSNINHDLFLNLFEIYSELEKT